MSDPVSPRESRAVAPRATGVAGLVFAALFMASILLLRDHPAPGSTAAEVSDWYLNERGRIISLVGLYLAPFAGIAFLWFIAVVRHHLGDREDRLFATVFLGSGLLFVAMLFAAAASAGGLQASVQFQGAPSPSPDAVVLARSLAYAFLYVYAMRSAAVFMLVVSTIGMRSGFLPRWLVVAGYAGGLVLLLSTSYFQLMVLVFPVWVALVSIVILVRADRSTAWS